MKTWSSAEARRLAQALSRTYKGNVTTLPRGVFGPCWSMKPIATLDARRSPESVCSVRLVDDRGRVLHRTGRRGRLADGRSIDFFRTGVVATALGCRVQCIYGWEEAFGFPRPSWNVVRPDGTAFTSRLYARNQLFAIQLLHHQFGHLRGPFRERVADFVSSVSLVFDLVPWLPVPEVTKFVGAVLVAHRDGGGESPSTQQTFTRTDRANRAPGEMGSAGVRP